MILGLTSGPAYARVYPSFGTRCNVCIFSFIDPKSVSYDLTDIARRVSESHVGETMLANKCVGWRDEVAGNICQYPTEIELRHDGVGAADRVVDVAQEHVPALDVAVHLRDLSSAWA
jgi:hypothetical protein